jgi:hypothetical protein
MPNAKTMVREQLREKRKDGSFAIRRQSTADEANAGKGSD